MSTAVLDKIRTERDQARAAALQIAEGDNFDPEDKNYLELEARAAELDARVASLAGLLEKQAAADALDGRLAKSMKAREERSEQGRTETRPGSWGEMFVRSEVYQEYKQVRRGTSSIFEVTDTPQTRALPTGISDLVDAGFQLSPTVVDVTNPPAPTPILDNVTTVNVSGNAIEYVFWGLTPGGGAQVVPEKGAKPASEWVPDVASDTLQTIAHYTQLTRQLIEDLPAVQSLINTELQRGVLMKEEEEAAGQISAATIPTAEGADLLAAIRVGIGTVQAEGYQPNAVMLNPADYAALDIAVMGVTSNGPTVGTGFWGLTPIPSNVQPAGTATVGDFRTGVQHFVRSQVQLYITDSHADTFLSNVFTLLAERRSKTAVVRPDALCNVTVAAPAVQSSAAKKTTSSS